MARPWRIEYEGVYYHVLSSGNEGRDIFYEEEAKKTGGCFLIHWAKCPRDFR
ncbi:MAG: hypothetical protein JRD43_01685 [Deltaproteobacteria bacterium]|nr:hypothetical protein [Deltaproteobacteria bacterium]